MGRHGWRPTSPNSFTREAIMASEKVLTLTETNFDSTLQGSPVPVLVDFWAEWCMPCKRLAPTIDAVAHELEGKMSVGKLNVDDHPGVSARFGIRGIPTLILFKGGQAVDQIVGLVSKDELKKMVSAHI
jgi:thioredoxin 1